MGFVGDLLIKFDSIADLYNEVHEKGEMPAF